MPKARHPVILSLAAIVLLLVCANFGAAVLFLVGVPGFFILVGVAGGARMPSKIPGRDTILYVESCLHLPPIDPLGYYLAYEICVNLVIQRGLGRPYLACVKHYLACDWG
jgi:hypothetical protein